jgi:hypothetical protein
LAFSTYVTNRSLVQVNVHTENPNDVNLIETIERHGFTVSENGVGQAVYDLSIWVDQPFSEEEIRATFGLGQSDSLVVSIFDLLASTDFRSGSILEGELLRGDEVTGDAIRQVMRAIADSVFSDINRTGQNSDC